MKDTNAISRHGHRALSRDVVLLLEVAAFVHMALQEMALEDSDESSDEEEATGRAGCGGWAGGDLFRTGWGPPKGCVQLTRCIDHVPFVGLVRDLCRSHHSIGSNCCAQEPYNVRSLS